jgi:hypothetical protein
MYRGEGDHSFPETRHPPVDVNWRGEGDRSNKKPDATCLDVPGWHDSDGAEFGCAFYDDTKNACKDYGDTFKNQGLVANEACCGCGGGCSAGIACYGGGGGVSVPTCIDVSGWYDSIGPEYNCNFYKNTPDACYEEGHLYENFGYTANSACCACRYGTVVSPPVVSPPVVSPPVVNPPVVNPPVGACLPGGRGCNDNGVVDGCNNCCDGFVCKVINGVSSCGCQD